MPSYILRNVDRPDPSVWPRVLKRSKEDGIPLRAVIMKLLEMYADRRIGIAARREVRP